MLPTNILKMIFTWHRFNKKTRNSLGTIHETRGHLKKIQRRIFYQSFHNTKFYKCFIFYIENSTISFWNISTRNTENRSHISFQKDVRAIGKQSVLCIGIWPTYKKKKHFKNAWECEWTLRAFWNQPEKCYLNTCKKKADENIATTLRSLISKFLSYGDTMGVIGLSILVR